MLVKLERRKDLHICAYNLAFAIIPRELLDVFPLSQSVEALPLTTTTINDASKRMANYLKAAAYKQCIIVLDQTWQKKIARSIRSKLGRKMRMKTIEAKHDDEGSLSQIPKALRTLNHRKRIS
jgi:hypothetical protein